MDHTITVGPGAEFPVQADGEFVFCKFADRDIRVIIGNSPRTMRAGSKWRPAGGFGAGDVIVQNLDPVNPVAVVLTIGVGDFDDQIIHGEVTVNPGIRNAAGVFVDDTRRDIDLFFSVHKAKPAEYYMGQFIQLGEAYISKITPLPGRDASLAVNNSENEIYLLPHGGGLEILDWPEGRSFGTCGVRDGRIWVLQGGATAGVFFLESLDPWTFETVSRVQVVGVTLPSPYAETTNVAWDPVSGHFFVWAQFGIGVGAEYRLLKIAPNGAVVASVETDSVSVDDTIVVYQGVVHLLRGGIQSSTLDVYSGNLVALSYEDRTLLAAVDTDLGGHPGGLDDSGRWMLIQSGVNGPYGWIVLDDYTVSMTGSASGCDGAVISDFETAPTDARVVVRRDESGRWVASGQVLKALLDFYFGRLFVADDYLSHIYAVRFERANGVINHVVSTGGKPFSLAGVVDDFQNVPFPQRVVITASRDLVTE